jgi:secreted Zn-dependent insulinase-like peptidase
MNPHDIFCIQQVISHNCSPTHPYSRFGWGNRKSLKEMHKEKQLNVREAILNFYERYYSANIMKLVVCGENPLDEMEKWVASSFSKIKNKNIEPLSFASFGHPFGVGIDTQPLLCRIIPVRDIHTLHISWPIPPVFGLHHQKPHDYIASLIGHESEGSILSNVSKLVVVKLK